jgi:hypothetical protein
VSGQATGSHSTKKRSAKWRNGGLRRTGRNGTITRGVLRRYKSTETLPIDPQLVAIVSYSHLLFLLKGIKLMNKRAVNQTASSTAHHTVYIYNVIFYINK